MVNRINFKGYERAKSTGEVFSESIEDAVVEICGKTMGYIKEITISTNLFNNIRWETLEKQYFLSESERSKIMNLTEFTLQTSCGPIRVIKGS